jgi:SHS2 domain-containing protein
MPYEFVEDQAIADVAFIARGRSLEELFHAAADATMNVMVDDLATIERKTEKAIAAEAEAEDLLLVNFLQELIYYKDAEQLLLRPDEITITRSEARVAARARCFGEKLDPAKHELKVDVKAVTLHRLKVERTGAGWEAFVILDI